MDIKDMDFFRLEDRMLFEAAAAANIVAAADAAQNAGDDGNNNEEKNNNDLNVALFVAPEANADNTENTDIAAVADIDAQAKDIVEGALPAMDDANTVIPAAAADIDADADVDAHHDFVEGTLHVDNTDSFTVGANDADVDADHDILSDWLPNGDIDINADDVSVDGAIATIAAEHTVIDIDADADDANSDDFYAATRTGNHDLSIGFTAHKVYDGTNDVEGNELQMNAILDGEDLSVSGIYNNNVWTFRFSDDANNDYLVMVQNVTFDGTDVTTDSITIGSFAIDGDALADFDISVNGEELIQTRAAENLRADGVIDQRDLTIKVRDANMTYGDDESSLKFHYDITNGNLLKNEFISAQYTLSPELDAYRTTNGNIQYNEDPYENAVSLTARIFDIEGNNVSTNYVITTESGSLTVAQRVLSITIQTYTVEYGEDLGDAPNYVDKDGNPVQGYSFDPNSLVEGDNLNITLKYDTDVIEANKVLSGSGNLQSNLYPLAIISDKISLDNEANYNLKWNYGSLRIAPKQINVDYLVAPKTYDGTTDADRGGDFILSQPILEGDVVRLFDTEVDYTFAQPDVGKDIEVTATDKFFAVGPDANNYEFHFNLISKGDINPADVTISFTANDKVYDGNTDATLDTVKIDGVIANGDVTIDASKMTYAFADKNVGTGKTVTADGYSNDLLGGAKLHNYNVNFVETATAAITPLAIDIGFTANNKIYDGNTTAIRDGLLMDNVLEGDEILFNDTGIEYNFDTKDVGTGKTVIATGYDESMLSGKDLGNYKINFIETTTADITKLAITIGFTATDKVYDGNTDATRDQIIMPLIGDDEIVFDDSTIKYSFDNKDVDNGKTVTATGYDVSMLSGKDLKNYDITFKNTATAAITPLTITIGFTANDKVYDGNTTAGRDQLVMDAVIEGDDVKFDDTAIQYNFEDKNVGEGKTVTATGYSDKLLSGADLANYTIEFDDTATAAITPLAISIGFTAKDKVYDGNTAAERVDLLMDEVLEGDKVVFDDSAITYNFDNKNAGEGKTVTATGYNADTMLSGDDIDNYKINFIETATAAINKLAISIGFTANNKPYDGNTTATRDQLLMDKVLEGDNVQFDDSAIEYNFDTKEPGEGKTVTATGYDESMLSGDDLANYDITFIDTAKADITFMAITIKADNKTMIYGDDTPSLTFVCDDPLAEGHTLSVTLALNIDKADITDSGHIKAGSYAESITAVATVYDANGEVVTDDYVIEYEYGDLTVDMRNITVTAASQEMTYGDEMPALDGQYSFDPNALASGDSLTVTLDYDIKDSDKSASGNVTAGLHPGMIVEKSHVLSNDGNYNYTFNAASLNVLAKEITVRFDAKDKTYDGNTVAERNGDFIRDGFVDGDVVRIFDADVTYAFDNKNVGDDKTVTATGELVYVGDDVANYEFTFENTALADITPKTISIGFTAKDKVYDGNTEATRDQLVMNEILEGDDVQFDDSELDYDFSDKNVGTDKTVTATGFDAETMLSGADLANYDITFVDTTTADIAKLAINIGFTANDKVYDGNTTATRDQLVMDAVIEGDDVKFDDSAIQYNFDDKNVGEGKAVTATGYNAATMLSGDDLQNYDITFDDTATAAITKLAITIGFTANDKTYDGNTDATRDQLVMDNVLEGDDVQFDDSAITYNFDNKNAGEGKTVTATGYNAATMLSGDDLDNYKINFIETTTAAINKLAISIGFTAADKKYDGNTEATRVDLIMDQVLEGDDVSFDDSAIEYNFDTKEPGIGKTVTATGYDESMLSGADLQNYEVTFIETTTASITYLTITVTADDKTMIYGDAEPSLTYTYKGDLAEGHMISVALTLNIDENNITDSAHIKAGGYTDSITAVATIYDENGAVVTDDYTIVYDFGDLTVDMRNITVTAASQEMTYGDEMPALDGQYSFDPNALASGDSLTVTLDYDIKDSDKSTSGNVNAGLHPGMIVEKSHILSNDGNYNYTFNAASLNVLAKEITVRFDAKDKTYDGNTDAERDGEFIRDGFVEGDVVRIFDADVTYAFDNKNVGEDKTVTATGELVYVGDDVANYEFTFENTALADITPKPIHIGITAQDKTYDGNTKAQPKGVTMDEVLEGDDVSFTPLGLEYNFDTKNVGDDKTVTATGFNAETMLSGEDLQNYNITFDNTTTADVTPLDITIGFTANDKVYDGNTEAKRDELVMDQVIDGDDVQFDAAKLKYNFDTKNAGEEKTVTATGFDAETMLSGEDLANYNITFVETTKADVTPLPIKIGFTAQDKVYDGNTHADRKDLKLDDVIKGDDVQFDDTGMEYNFDNKNIGEAKTVTATGFNPETMLSGEDLGNYDITFEKSVFIDTALANITPLPITIKVDDKSMIYGDQTPSLTYTFDEKALVGDDMIQINLALDIADSDKTAAGNIKANVEGYKNAITADAKIYDSEGIPVTGNYNITYEYGTLKVDLRNITVTAKQQEMTYGDVKPSLDGQYTFDPNALVEGDELDVTLTYEIPDTDHLSSSGNVTAGLHSGVVVEESHALTNGENYNYTFNAASLNVKPKDITVSFNANDKPYDGTTQATQDGDFIIDGLVSGDEIIVFDTDLAYAFDAPTVLRDADGNVLDRTVTATGELITVGKDVDNYNITFDNTTEAKIKPLEVTVTAHNQSMTYGNANPDLTGEYDVTGVLEIDTLTVTLAYDTANIPTSASGHFKAGEHDDAIIEGNHTLTNADSYNYTFKPGDLSVAKRPVSIAADDKKITYGEDVGELTYVFTGELADGDSTDGTILTVDGEENANGHYNAGEYDIIIGELSLDENDYEITYNPGTLIVNQKEITIKADDKTKEERRPDPRLTYTVEGLLDDDTLTGRLTREPGEAPGEYEIQQGTLTSDDNYIITYIPGTLTITERAEEPEPEPEPILRNIYQEPDQSNRNYNGPMNFEVMDYRPVIPDIHPKWDFRSRFDEHCIDPLANSQDLWMDVDSLDTILVSKVISASNSANERGFSSGNEMFPNDTQTSIMSVQPSDDFDAPLIDYIDIHGSNDNDMPWIFMDESIQIPKFLEQNIADDASEDADMLDSLADVRLDELNKHAAFKSDVELLLDGLLA